MTHTALTADEEIRRIRGRVAAREALALFGEGHPQLSPRRRPAAEVACRDVLSSAPPQSMLVMRAQARLATVIRRLGRRPADVIVGRALSATDSSIAN